MWPYALSKIGYASANATRLSKIRGYLLVDLPSNYVEDDVTPKPEMVHL